MVLQRLLPSFFICPCRPRLILMKILFSINKIYYANPPWKNNLRVFIGCVKRIVEVCFSKWGSPRGRVQNFLNSRMCGFNTVWRKSKVSFSSGRARTCNLAVNSRSLYHWVTEECFFSFFQQKIYEKQGGCQAKWENSWGIFLRGWTFGSYLNGLYLREESRGVLQYAPTKNI